MRFNYRRLYEETYGTIPKDDQGRSFDIHHIDGDRTNNNISNLIALSIEDHYAIHRKQGDWGACKRLAQRLNLVADFPPWNKGKTGIFSEETLEKLRRPKPDSQKQKLSEIGKTLVGEKNPFFGKKHTEETLQKISAKLKGREISPEWRAKLSASGKGRKFTEEHKQNLRLSALKRNGKKN